MNIRSIKSRANELLVYSKPQFIRILIIMLLVGLVPSLFNNSRGLMALISLIVSIIFLPFDHGYIVSSLKIVRNNYTALKDEDAWVGFSRFKELFPTYLIVGLIRFAIVFCITFVLLFLLTIFNGATLSHMSSMTYNANVDTLVRVLMASPAFLMQTMVVLLIIVIVNYILSIYLFAVPYLLEQYHMETMTAIRESIQFINGYAFDLFKLDLSYFGWFFLIGIVDSLLAEFLGSIPFVGTLVVAILCGLLKIYVFLPQYYLSRTIFFEEIAYQRYEVHQQQPFDNVNDYNREGE